MFVCYIEILFLQSIKLSELLAGIHQSDPMGILVPPFDSSALVEATLQLIFSPELRNTLGMNAYKYMQQANWKNIAEQYIELAKKYKI